MKAILTYHSVDETGSVISVTPRQLEQHLDALASREVRIVPLSSLLLLPPSVDAAALTFDDGYANFAAVAAPLLVARTSPATVFVVPSHVGTENRWEAKDSRSAVPHLPLMGWAELAQIRSQGFEIGGHGLSHRSLCGLDSVQLESEVRDCAASIEERLGAGPVSFAFPYGDFDDAAIETVARTYSLACTTTFGLLSERDSRKALPRLDMYYFRWARMLSRWGSPEFKAYVTARKIGRRLGRSRRGGQGRGG